MQRFVGVVSVQAEPKQNGHEPGYRVLYPGGRETWEPAEEFERAFSPLPPGWQAVDRLAGQLVQGVEVLHESARPGGGGLAVLAARIATGRMVYALANWGRDEERDQAMRDARDEIVGNLADKLQLVLDWAMGGIAPGSGSLD